MKVMGIRGFRGKAATISASGEPMLVTRHGKLSGVYIPLAETNRLSDDLRRELVVVIGKHVAGALARKGVTERHLKKDFNVHRRRHPCSIGPSWNGSCQ